MDLQDSHQRDIELASQAKGPRHPQVREHRHGTADKIDDDPYFNGDEAQRLLFKAIAGLPQKQKSVFCLRYFDDLSYEDISEILGTSVGALKASYHFASEKIRAELQDQIKP